MPEIAVIDYGLGKLGSLVNMLKRLGADVATTTQAAVITKAKKLILPGVGAFDTGVKNLQESGLISLLTAKVLEEGTPILGICLGMQLLSRRSEEGNLPGLGWLDAETVRFKFDGLNAGLKIPHMGWNQLRVRKCHPVMAGLESDSRFYFVHSYHVICANESNVLAQTTYGFDFVSAVVKDNVLGVQFHPEKSHRYGMRLLRNFLENV